MGLNNRKISNQFRTIHRYLGFFLSGIMLMYSISGITLIFRKTDTFKKKVLVEEQIEKGLTQPPKIKGAKNIVYQADTGKISYSKMEPPKLIGMMEKVHKATTADPLYFFNIFFGMSLFFFVFSSYWMFLPETAIFKKAIYFTLAGMVLTVVMFLF